MDEDVDRKISNIKRPSDAETESEEYENAVTEIKNQGVS